MTEFTMVVPTYWGRAGAELIRNEKIVFDHPTSLDENGTLARLLDSLRVLVGADKLKIVIIPVPNDPQIAGEVDRKVDSIINPFRSQYITFGYL